MAQHHTGLLAALLNTLILLSVLCLGPCHNSKITFPNANQPAEQLSISETFNFSEPVISRKILFAEPSPETANVADASQSLNNSTSSSPFIKFSDSSENSSYFSAAPVYSLFPGEPLENNEVDVESDPEAKGFIRSMEISDNPENPDRKLYHDREPEEMRGWAYEDDRRSPPPDEKTIAFQVLDEDPYHHGRPAWPHDEYILNLPYFDIKSMYDRVKGVINGTSSAISSSLGGGSGNNGNENHLNGNPLENTLSPDELERYYEWRRLQPKPSPSAFIGPGFYDVGAESPSSSSDYYRYHQPTYQAITDSGSGKIQTTGASQDGDGSVPGTPSESNTNTRGFPAYIPYDFYKRKRLRLQIHPGLIAAPLAGLAAFGAASALTSKPLLLELGYVRNKPDLINGGGAGGGWGWVGSPAAGGFRPYPPFYPPPNPPPYLPPLGVGTGHVHSGGYPVGGGITHSSALGSAGGHHGGGAPIYPILKPIRHRPESERSSWWNPFSGLTPRLVVE